MTAAEEYAASEPEYGRTNTIGAFVRLARPKQWVKNVLVIAAPAAAGLLGE